MKIQTAVDRIAGSGDIRRAKRVANRLFKMVRRNNDTAIRRGVEPHKQTPRERRLILRHFASQA